MASVYGGLKKILGVESLPLPLDDERVNGEKINLFNFQIFLERYTFSYENNGWILSNLRDPRLDQLPFEKILQIQWELIKNQIHFTFSTTPAIYYLWKNIFGLSPDDINSWDDFQKIPPITKTHQRLLGWPNFLPFPIADLYLNGIPNGYGPNAIDPNLIISQEKWTGGTTALYGSDFIQIIITEADWRASVDTMERILNPVSEIVSTISMGATTYDQRHIARPIFEAQLRRYGKHLLARAPGCSDEAWLWQINELGFQAGVAPPVDHPLKGIGWPGMIDIGGKFKLALMSSTVPTPDILKKMITSGMAILNVGGDTGSLPTYYSLIGPNIYDYKDDKTVLTHLEDLRIISLGPAYTEIVSPVDLSCSLPKEEGILLQTNFAAVWNDVKTNRSHICPALKSQMIRSSATGNLVKVTGVDELKRPKTFNRNILRYNDFRLNTDLRPIYENPHVSGGTSRGGCAG